MQSAAIGWVERFMRYLAYERRVSPHTSSAYETDLSTLIAFCDKAGVKNWAALDVANVRAFAARSNARGMAPASVQRRLSAVRSFLKFLVREGAVPYNTATDISAPKARRKLPHTLDVDQVAALIERPKLDSDPLAVRDRAILELLYSSGLRLAELIGLNVHDVDLHDRTVRVLGKGSRERVVPVGRKAAEALQRYLPERRRRAKPGETALFVGRRGRRLTGRNVQTRIAQWARRAGIRQHVHPHLLRHSFATHMLESSGDIRAVQELLGHASISTTAIYTHLNFQHMAKVYMAAHPRAKIAIGKEQP